MTAVPAPGRRNPLYRAALALGHAARPVIPWTGTLILAAFVVKWFAVKNFTTGLIAMGMVGVGLAVVLAEHFHSLRMCPRDTFDVANPQAEVDRHLRRLRLYHSRLLRIGAYAIIPFAIVPPMSGWPLWAAVAVCAAAAAALAVFLTSCFVTHTHRRLMIWCPFCRRGGGGDGDTADTPTPVPAGTA